MASAEPPRPVSLFTHPRTASNLLMQMLRTHHQVEAIEYPFVDTYYFGEESLTLRRNEHLDAVKQRMQADPALPQTFQAAFDQLELSIQTAQTAGKTALIKEHAFAIMTPETIAANLEHHSPRMERQSPKVTTQSAREQRAAGGAGQSIDEFSNPTVLPDTFLRSVTPVFLIRHPALVFESILRVSGPTMGAVIDDDEFAIEATFRWLRVLYDWFAKSNDDRDVHPVVLNADEIMAHPTIVQQLCEQLELDPEAVRFNWDALAPAAMEEQSLYHRHFFSTIQSSSGVRLDKHSAAHGQALDVDALSRGWQETYGVETAATLRSFVDAAMPDYEYLCLRELRLQGSAATGR